jgi:hypothetical protein
MAAMEEAVLVDFTVVVLATITAAASREVGTDSPVTVAGASTTADITVAKVGLMARTVGAVLSIGAN